MRLPLLVLLAACATTPADFDPDVGTDPASDTASDPSTDSDTERTDLASFSGRILDQQGAPVDGARVAVCRAICRTQRVDATGTFDFQIEPDTHSVHVEPPSGQGLANALFPRSFTANQVIALDITLPALSAERPLPFDVPAQLDLDGVTVTAQAGDLAVALSPDPVAALAGVRLPSSIWPPVELDGEVVAMWYLSPYNAMSFAGLPLSVTLEPGLATDGERLQVWRADYNAFAWIHDGDLIASPDGTLLQGDARLLGLTTLALLRPPAP